MNMSKRAIPRPLCVKCCCGREHDVRPPRLAALIVSCACGIEWLLWVDRKRRRASLERMEAKR